MTPEIAVRAPAMPAQPLLGGASEGAAEAPTGDIVVRFWIVSFALALLALTTLNPRSGGEAA